MARATEGSNRNGSGTTRNAQRLAVAAARGPISMH
jgi:hypothetical protein